MSQVPNPEQQGSGVCIAVLAAGHGKRMNSAMAKHLQPVGGVPIVERVIRAGLGISPDRVVAVVSPPMADLPARLEMRDLFTAIVQDVPEGTASAVLLALDHLPECTWVISLLGDNPLLTSEIVGTLLDCGISNTYKVALLTTVLDDAADYGRIERDADGRMLRIIELKNDEPSLRTGRTEINSGIMVIDAEWARTSLRRVQRNAQTQEFLLTDLIDLAVSERQDDEHWPVGTVVGEREGAVGVNDRAQLAAADSIVRDQVRQRLMADGVSFVGPETSFIDETVRIGRDTVILPHSIITGRTTIGSDCTIGPHAVVHSARIGDRVRVTSSTVRDSEISAGSDVGPYAHLRANVRLGDGVHIGTSVELKNTTLGNGSRSGHFSYLGDTTVGKDVNIGAGTITANFDGHQKHRTVIGDHAFIGSDTVLVAPVVVGDEGRTGAGSVVNRDVAAGATVVGVPARALISKQVVVPSDDGDES